jgi:hypothetical protein
MRENMETGRSSRDDDLENHPDSRPRPDRESQSEDELIASEPDRGRSGSPNRDRTGDEQADGSQKQYGDQNDRSRKTYGDENLEDSERRRQRDPNTKTKPRR